MPKAKIKCAARFEVEIRRTLHIEDIEFSLDATDAAHTDLVIDSKLIERYVQFLLEAGDLDNVLNNATVHDEDSEDPEILEIVSFTVENLEPPKPEPDPNQTELLS